MDFLTDFINWLGQNGCEPANPTDIIADDNNHRLQTTSDKKGESSATYCLRIDSNYAVGYLYNFRAGESYTYHRADKDNPPTKEQIAAQKKAIEKRKEEQAELKKEAEARAIVEIHKKWEAATPAENHPYLQKKKVGAYGLKILGDELLIPLTDGDNLINLQRISPEGNKKFIAGGRTKGGYHLFLDFGIDDICVCEGYATGATIHEATKKAVAVAFNAGNLKAVAITMKKKYPKSRIIICADNDWENLESGKNAKNVGVDAGNAAVAAIGGAFLIYPPEIENCTDFNDMAAAQSLEAVADLFEKRFAASHAETFEYGDVDITHELPPIEAYSEEVVGTIKLYKEKSIVNGDWRANLLVDSKGCVVKTMNNTLLFLKHDEVLSNLFCYDEFCQESVVYRCPPWEKPDKFNVRTLNDEDKTMLTIELEKRGVVQPFATVERLLMAIIKENSRNPAVEFFNSLEWDKKPRLDSWLIDYLGCKKDNQDYVRAIGRKWLTAAVARVFNPGAKFDHMLILEGKQRIGKSLALRELATFRGKSFFLDTLRVENLGERDTTLSMQGKIIIEFAELTGMHRADVAALKQTISNQEDRCRLNYSNSITTYPRQFVLAGTYNPDGVGIFSDPTGNERFWVVGVGDKLDIEDLKRDKEQLWAEAVENYKSGNEKLYLEDETAERAKEAQEYRMSEVPWQDDLEPLIYGKQVVYVRDIWKGLGVTDVTKKTKAFQNEISRVMAKNKFEKVRLRKDGVGNPEYAWRRIDARLSEPEPQEESLEF